MSERKKRSSFKELMESLGKAMKHLVLHNGWLKLIAILISVFLWAGLISQDESVTRDKTFQNVSVNITGSETLKSNSMIVVSDLEEALSDVSIVAEVPQKQYENAEASAYNIRLDLSRISGTGEQEVKILSTNSSTYGRVVSINPSSVVVNVEDYMIRQRIPVSVTIEGEVPEGWYMSSPAVDPALVTVSGPSSLVKTISRARAFINTRDIEWKEGTIVTSSEIVLYKQGEQVVSPLLSTTTSNLAIDSVVIEMNLLPSETFELKDLIQINGNVAGDYKVKSIRISPETITVAARLEVLEQMSELPLERNSINLDDLTETTVFQLKVQKPSDDAILSNDTVTVTVEIEPKQP